MRLLGRRQAVNVRPFSDDDTRVAWQCASWLLSYPNDEVYGRLDEIERAAAKLPVREDLLRLVAYLRTTDRQVVQSLFVDTFDYTRKCSLYLTYFSTGDTRKRGVALVQFKQAYRRAGALINDDELPDHLCVLLDFGAAVDIDIAWRLLTDHRPGLETLRLALEHKDSPWLGAAAAVCATLPALDGEGADAVARLLAAGPPSEDVGLGLDAYSLDPKLNPPVVEPAVSARVGGVR